MKLNFCIPHPASFILSKPKRNRCCMFFLKMLLITPLRWLQHSQRLKLALREELHEIVFQRRNSKPFEWNQHQMPAGDMGVQKMARWEERMSFRNRGGKWREGNIEGGRENDRSPPEQRRKEWNVVCKQTESAGTGRTGHKQSLRKTKKHEWLNLTGELLRALAKRVVLINANKSEIPKKVLWWKLSVSFTFTLLTKFSHVALRVKTKTIKTKMTMISFFWIFTFTTGWISWSLSSCKRWYPPINSWSNVRDWRGGFCVKKAQLEWGTCGTGLTDSKRQLYSLIWWKLDDIYWKKIFSGFSLDVLHLLCLKSVEFLALKWIYLLLRFCLKLNVANCTRVNSWSTQPETGRSLWEEQEREYSHATVPLADSASGCQEHKPSQKKHFGAVFPAINLVGLCSAQLGFCLERVTELQNAHWALTVLAL